MLELVWVAEPNSTQSNWKPQFFSVKELDTTLLGTLLGNYTLTEKKKLGNYYKYFSIIKLIWPGRLLFLRCRWGKSWHDYDGHSINSTCFYNAHDRYVLSSEECLRVFFKKKKNVWKLSNSLKCFIFTNINKKKIE